jgi:hypothetical protein
MEGQPVKRDPMKLRLLSFGMALVIVGAIVGAVTWSWVTWVGVGLVFAGAGIVVFVGETTK